MTFSKENRTTAGFVKRLDAETYQDMIDQAERAETAAILRSRLTNRNGETRTVDEVFNDLSDKHGFGLNDDEI